MLVPSPGTIPSRVLTLETGTRMVRCTYSFTFTLTHTLTHTDVATITHMNERLFHSKTGMTEIRESGVLRRKLKSHQSVVLHYFNLKHLYYICETRTGVHAVRPCRSLNVATPPSIHPRTPHSDVDGSYSVIPRYERSCGSSVKQV